MISSKKRIISTPRLNYIAFKFRYSFNLINFSAQDRIRQLFLNDWGEIYYFFFLFKSSSCASTIFIALALHYFSTIQKTLGPAFIYKHAQQQFSTSPTGPSSGSAPSSSGSVSFRMSILRRNFCLYDGSQISVPFKDKALWRFRNPNSASQFSELCHSLLLPHLLSNLSIG